MKLWLRAICDYHGEGIKFFVSNPSCTAYYLSDYNAEIQEWIETHYGCGLRIVGTDQQLDELWEDGYKIDYGNKLGRVYRKNPPKNTIPPESLIKRMIAHILDTACRDYEEIDHPSRKRNTKERDELIEDIIKWKNGEL